MQTHTEAVALLPPAGPAEPSPRTRVRAIVSDLLASPSIAPAFSDDDTLTEVGLTSLDMVKLMLAVETAFIIEIPQADITPETFRSVATIKRLVCRLTAAA